MNFYNYVIQLFALVFFFFLYKKNLINLLYLCKISNISNNCKK